jgi:transposase
MVSFEAVMNNEKRLKELERRRTRAARLLAAGVKQAEVARRVGVSRQAVQRWERVRQHQGVEGLKRPARFGRPPKLSEAQCKELVAALKQGALAAGFATELWTLPRVGLLIKERFGVALAESSVWRVLGELGWSVQRPAGQARQRDERAIRTWKAKRWPALKKSQRDRVE